MQYEKMPRFLNQTQTSMTKQNMAPVSGSTSIRQQTDMLIETYRDEKPGRHVAHSYTKESERVKTMFSNQAEKLHSEIISMTQTDPYQLISDKQPGKS